MEKDFEPMDGEKMEGFDDYSSKSQNTPCGQDSFSAGDSDGNLFHIPSKIYGRDNEVKKILETYNKAACGKAQYLFISGFSGIGKTSLVDEALKGVSKDKFIFIEGKFEQFRQNTPYSAVIQAMGQLVKLLLGQSDEELQLWKDKILEAVGGNGQVLTSIQPEFEIIIGKQPELRILQPIESQNRFNLVLKNFIKVFTNKNCPIIFFIDDLQWVDDASLKLFQVLITEADLNYFLIIGAYRENEVRETHPLLTLFSKMEKEGKERETIVLEPLGESSLHFLLSDTLDVELAAVEELAKIVFAKTNGNPFFIKEFLKHLYSSHLITYDSRWQWDLPGIQQSSITGNVVELMSRNILRFSERILDILKTASVMGSIFYMDILVNVYKKDEKEIYNELKEAISAGILIVYKDEMKFVHDKVREAAYSLVPQAEKKALHYRIGKAISLKGKANGLLSRIFIKADQLNSAFDLLTDPEVIELIRLNMEAGFAAKKSNAFGAALKYFRRSLELLSSGSWQTEYRQTLTIYSETAELEFLNSNYDESLRLSGIILEKAKNVIDRVRSCELEMMLYMTRLDFVNAIDCGLEGLKALGINISPKPSFIPALFSFQKIKWKLGALDINRILKFKECNDLKVISALRIITTILPNIGLSVKNSSALVITLISRAFELMFAHGISSYASVLFAYYAFVLCFYYNEIDMGQVSADIADALIERYNAVDLINLVYLLEGLTIRHWKIHAGQCLDYFKKSYHYGYQTGNLKYSTHSIYFFNQVYPLFIGTPLNFLLDESSLKWKRIVSQSGQVDAIFTYTLFERPILALTGRTKSATSFSGEDFDEKKTLDYMIEINFTNGLFNYYIFKSFICYLFYEYDESFKYIQEAQKVEEAGLGSIFIPVLYLFYGLILCSIYPKFSLFKKVRALKKLKKMEKKLKFWANSCPDNYQHKYLFLKAEIAVITGKTEKAGYLYDRTIVSCREYKFLNLEAMAYERAALFYFSKKMSRKGEIYIVEARNCYLKWGALTKASFLERDYAHLFDKKEPLLIKRSSPGIAREPFTSSGKASGTSMDIPSSVKAAHLIARKICDKRVGFQVNEALVKSCGAQKGILVLLNTEGKLCVESINQDGEEKITENTPKLLDENRDVPRTLIRYVARTEKDIVIADLQKTKLFKGESYFVDNKTTSIFCSPVVQQGQLMGIFYLEHSLLPGFFTKEKIELLKILSFQFAAALENSLLYDRSIKLNQKILELMKEKEVQRQQLIQVDKLVSLGTLASSISHEIANPNNAISNTAQFFKKYLPLILEKLDELYEEDRNLLRTNIPYPVLKEEMEQGVEGILKSAGRIGNISQQLKSFYKSVNPGLNEKIYFNEVVISSVSLISFEIEKVSFEPSLTLEKKIPMFTGNFQQLEQVMVNLLINAIHALKERELSSESKPENPLTITTSYIKEEKCIKCVIKDRGVGIKKELLKKITEPFFTTKQKTGGTGLGLNISRNIISRHNGKILFESEPGEGTEVTLLFFL